MKRNIEFKYRLLNFDELEIGEISVLNGNVGMNSLAQIKRTGRFTFKENEAKHIDFLNDRLQVSCVIDGIEHSLGNFLLPSPKRVKSNQGIIREVEAYDVTQILLEDKFTDRHFIKKGTKYTSAVTQIIQSAGIRKTDIYESDSLLNRDREFEIGTSKLSAINELLNEMNYTSLYSDERGVLKATPYILPMLKPIDFEYKNDELSVITNDGFSDELDIFNAPNIFVGIVSNGEGQSLKSKYINENPSSPLSTISRRRNIVDVREVSDIASQEALDGYIKMIANESSSKYSKIEFNTLIVPEHSYSNCLYINHDKLDLSGKYQETSWEIDLRVGGKMKHNARKVVLL